MNTYIKYTVYKQSILLPADIRSVNSEFHNSTSTMSKSKTNEELKNETGTAPRVRARPTYYQSTNLIREVPLSQVIDRVNDHSSDEVSLIE